LLTARRIVIKPNGQLHGKIANMIVIANVAYDCQNNYVSYTDCNIWGLYIY
jgi:hypothetical protein